MFTGLVQAVGRVSVVEVRPLGMRLGVDVGSWGYGRKARAGASVSVAGVCLTVVGKPKKCVFLFDVVRETLEKTRLGELRVGERVNLEHAATASTLMGGHIVQGHVDGVGRVARINRGNIWEVWIALPPVRAQFRSAAPKDPRRCITILEGRTPRPTEADLWNYLVAQGAVCVEGVSLTIAGLWENTTVPERSRDSFLARERGRGFRVALIPTTLRKTTLGVLLEGTMVNLEMDVIAKMVSKQLEAPLAHRGVRSPVSRTKKK